MGLMKAIEIKAPGGPQMLHLRELPDPLPQANEVRIRVVASGVNRPDVLQRQGLYSPPPGASQVPGLEVAGEVEQVGPGCTRLKEGDRVAALVSGGGYGELCVAPEAQCLQVPESVSLKEAAAVPETWFTVWSNVFELGKLQAGETLLVHGGSSGIGHTAIQLAKAFGARVITTSSSEEKANFCRSVGADFAFNYRQEDFVEASKEVTKGQGVNLVLDMVGGDYMARNLDVLGFRGRHISIAFLRGMVAELPIQKVMGKQLTLSGSFLRPRSLEEKSRLRKSIEDKLWPLFVSGQVRPHIDTIYPLHQASTAHEVMESGDFFGKLVLEP